VDDSYAKSVKRRSRRGIEIYVNFSYFELMVCVIRIDIDLDEIIAICFSIICII